MLLVMICGIEQGEAWRGCWYALGLVSVPYSTSTVVCDLPYLIETTINLPSAASMAQWTCLASLAVDKVVSRGRYDVRVGFLGVVTSHSWEMHHEMKCRRL